MVKPDSEEHLERGDRLDHLENKDPKDQQVGTDLFTDLCLESKTLDFPKKIYFHFQ